MCQTESQRRRYALYAVMTGDTSYAIHFRRIRSRLNKKVGRYVGLTLLQRLYNEIKGLMQRSVLKMLACISLAFGTNSELF